MATKAPGLKWILILGLTGFAAGFFGPMIFVPDANQGPLVGILISGPAGALVGLILFALCALFKPVPRTQWRLLYTIATLGVITTLFYVQPEPALRGYVYDGEVQSCSSPRDAEDAVLDEWKQRIADVTWTPPRSGWQRDMHQLLTDAPGAVVSVQMLRKNAIRENRKPWNRGSQFASGWTAQPQETRFYDADNGCDHYPQGREFRGFQKYDLNGRIEPPQSWPPRSLLEVLGASPMAPVPGEWSGI